MTMIEEEKNEEEKDSSDDTQKPAQEKFYCESCGDEITEEEYKEHHGMCRKCFL